MRKDDNTIVGIIFIVIGVIIGGNIMGIWDFNLFFNGWWTLFLIIPGVIEIIRKGPRVDSIILTAIGVILLLNCWHIASIRWINRLIFPIILVGIGISIILPKKNRKKCIYADKGMYSNNQKYEYNVVFGSKEYETITTNYKYGEANSIFSNLSVDLSKTEFENEAFLELACVFGSLRIILPKDVKVEIIDGSNVFGNIENKVNPEDLDKKIKISASAIFGSIYIL